MDTQTLKAMAEESMWDFAHGWHAGLGLTSHGVDLGDALEYDLLRVLGNVWKQHLDGLEAVAQQPAARKGAAQQ